MKKFISFFLSTLIFFVVSTGCATQQNVDRAPETQLPTVKVGLVTGVGGIADGGYNQSAWSGIQKAAEECGFEAQYLESSNDADYTPHMEALIQDGCGLIICTGGYTMVDSVLEVARAFPEKIFVLIDASPESELKNVISVTFNQAEVSYLVGVAAALTTQTNKIGIVLGSSNTTMNQFAYGYIAGARDTNPQVEVLQYNAKSFGDLPLGKSAAVDLIGKGADVIFHAAGGTGMGVIEGCAEGDIWAIGVDTDQAYLAPEHMLTSAMKRTDVASYDIAKAYSKGDLTINVRTYDVGNHGVDIAPTQDNLSSQALDAIQVAKEGIIAGQITVPMDKITFQQAYGDHYDFD